MTAPDAGRLMDLLRLAASAAVTLTAAVARQLVAELKGLLVATEEAAVELPPVDQQLADWLYLLTVRLAQAAPHQMVGLSCVLALVVQVDPKDGADLFLLDLTADSLCLCGQVPLNKR